MAQLVTKKEKYGVSVAARIDPELAHQISERAERLGLSFAKMVGMIITRGFNPQEPIVVDNSEEIDELENKVTGLESEVSDLEFEVEKQSRLYKNTAAEFISQIALDDTQKLQFVETYNEILDEQRAQLESE